MVRTYFIVDDDAMQNEIHALMLSKVDPDAEVFVFSSAKRALLAIAQGQSPDIIFLDLHIPGETATEFLDGHNGKNCPGDIYLMSSAAYFDQPELMQNYPAVKDFISKPLLDYKLKAVMGSLV